MKKIILSVLWIIVGLNCAKDRNFPLEQGGNEVRQTVITQTQNDDFYYMEKKNTGSSLNLLLGKASDEYSARILMHFQTFPDSSVIDSAKIILYTISILGDSSSSFNAKMFQIKSEWEETGVLDWTDPNLQFDSLTVLSEAEITPESSDSVIFRLDANLVQGWMDTTDANDNYGVWIDSDDATFIKDFYSRSSSNLTLLPKLRMRYHTTNQPDTMLSYTSVPDKDVFILIPNLKLDENLLYIGESVVFRSYLTFDVASQIDSNATINRAELNLVINQDYSLFDAAGATNLQLMRLTEALVEPESIVIDSTSLGYFGSVLEDTVTVNLTALVQLWTSRNSSYPNYGLLMQSISEASTLSRIAFHASSADSINAPKLIITYTLPPAENYY